MLPIKHIIYFITALFLFACSSQSNERSEDEDVALNNILIESIEYSNELNFEESFNTLQLLLKEAKEKENEKFEILANLNIGRLYYIFNQKDQALSYYLESLNLAEKYNEHKTYNAIYNNIGILYSENKLFEEAETYFRKALQISRELDSKNQEAINLINIATIKSEREQLDSALYYNNLTLKFLEENDLELYRSSVYNNIGELFLKENKYKEAKTNFLKALKQEKVNPEQNNLGIFELNLAQSYVQLLNYDSAKYFLYDALVYFKKSNNSELISDCYYWLTKNEQIRKSFPVAQSYFEECLAWKDSVLYQKKEQWVLDVQMKYEFNKIEDEIEHLEEKSKLQKRIIFSIILVSLIFILFIISIWRSRNRNLKQRNIILHKEKELSLLEMERNEIKRQKLEEEIDNEKQISKIKQEKIRLELEHKNNEVVSKAIHLMNKNEILNSIFDLAKQLDFEKDDKNSEIIKSMLKNIKNNISQDKAWEDFNLHFEKVHKSFIHQLKLKHQDLSPTDFRLCAYLLIGLHSKEIASVSNISPESVRKRKQRLREKLGLDSSIEIEEYLKSL